MGLIPGLGRSPGEGNGHPLQPSCLGNPMDRGAWQCSVPGVAESDKTEILNNNLDPNICWCSVGSDLYNKYIYIFLMAFGKMTSQTVNAWFLWYTSHLQMNQEITVIMENFQKFLF